LGVVRGRRPRGVVGGGERDRVGAERLQAAGGRGVADDVPILGVDDVHQNPLRVEKLGSKLRMYPSSSRVRMPQRSYCSCMTASASRSSSTPSPGPSGTGTAPSTNRSAPGATTSCPSCHGV